MYYENRKVFCVVALFCGAFVSAQATNVCVTSDAMGIEEVLQKKKGNPEEKMKKKSRSAWNKWRLR